MMAGMDDKNLTDPTGSKGGRCIGSYAVYRVMNTPRKTN